MIRLKKSEGLGKVIRQDDPEELAIPTWTLVRKAIRDGNTAEALALMDYESNAFKALQDSLVSFVGDVLTQLAKSNEEEVYEVFRKRYFARQSRLLSKIPEPKELLQHTAQNHRAHGGNLKITEEPDRYVVILDPCGSGGQLRRATEVGTTKKAYPWSWGKSGVPYYCAHCCVAYEILPIEIRGYHARIHLVADRPADPCVHLFYKKPELIPEEYFTRIGKVKTIK